jgi:hypothetical protein
MDRLYALCNSRPAARSEGPGAAVLATVRPPLDPRGSPRRLSAAQSVQASCELLTGGMKIHRRALRAQQPLATKSTSRSLRTYIPNAITQCDMLHCIAHCALRQTPLLVIRSPSNLGARGLLGVFGPRPTQQPQRLAGGKALGERVGSESAVELL